MDYWTYAATYYNKEANAYYMMADDPFSYATNDFLPTYDDHATSARCIEDIQNPAPSYFSVMYPPILSGADRLAGWLVARTHRAFGRQ
jgi:hypothetical protein